MSDRRLKSIREVKPTDKDWLHGWVKGFTGVHLARQAVCLGHNAPFDVLATQFFERPPITLVLGSRGSGKSFGSAIETHLVSRFNRRAGTRVLGGSAAQSAQIYEAIKAIALDGRGHLGSDGDSVADLLANRCKYNNGSEVSILACSSRSVRGPHIASLKLDEVDEIPDDMRDSALGMAMEQRGLSAAINMTSTWHNSGGPMGRLVERARAGEFPMFTFCAFEVLQRCPTERSGPNLEKCPDCPLFKWCHEDRFNDPSRPPRAKLADGHYAIDALIQKLKLGSARAFAADYLCKGPQAEGLWFAEFDRESHVTEIAEFRPQNGVVYLAIDVGVYTGAVFFQVVEQFDHDLGGVTHDVNVFADYVAEGRGAEHNARALLSIAERLCNGLYPGGRRDRVLIDPAGTARTSTGGPTTRAIYDSVGLRVESWPLYGVGDGLALVESFVRSADGRIGLRIHPRCTTLIAAFDNYRRAKSAGAWTDRPVDPQHPHEDVMDPLRSGLVARFPDGKRPEPKFANRSASNILF